MDWVLLIGRILFALIFVVSGLTIHLLKWRDGVQYARASGYTLAPELMVPLSGLGAVAGGLSVAIGVWPDLGALLLAGFAFPVAYFMHAFWKIEDPMMRGIQNAMFMKNVSMGGAALALFALFQQFGDEIGLTVTGPLF
jgi:putative oxidoreductase